MKKRRIAFLWLIALFFLFLCRFLISENKPVFATNEEEISRNLEAERLEIFDTINQLREEHGLDTLIIDSNLTAASQRQAEYLAETGKLTSEGPAHETLKTRAEDAGYGGGGSFNIQENIARIWTETSGTYLVEDVWKKEQISIRNMMAPAARHIGIGIADAPNKRRYVSAMFGSLSDGADTYTVVSTYDFRTPKPLISSTPTLVPMLTSTPHEDGGIYHVVQEGETFSEIALAYGLDWYTLSVLNHINTKTPVVIYEGDTLVIRPTFTLTPTPTASKTPHPPTSTPRPTYTQDAGRLHGTQTVDTSSDSAGEAPSERMLVLLQKIFAHKRIVGIFLAVLSGLGLLYLFFPKK